MRHFLFSFCQQRLSFVRPTTSGGGASSGEGDSDDEEEDEDEVGEEEEIDGEGIDGVGMSEAEERLVASFMNAGESVVFYAWFVQQAVRAIWAWKHIQQYSIIVRLTC